MQIPIAEAKARFADLVRRAEAGEEIELTRYGRPVARLTASVPVRPGGLLGCMAGAFPAPEPGQGDAEAAAALTGGPVHPR